MDNKKITLCIFGVLLFGKIVMAQIPATGTIQSTDTYISNNSLVVDDVVTNPNNSGNYIQPGLVFGSYYGSVGLSSNQTGGNYNHAGLDIYTGTTKRVAITSSGNVGIGSFYTSTSVFTTPSKLLHLRGASPIVFLESTSGSPAIQYGTSSTSLYDMTYTTSTAGGQLKIGPTIGTYKSLFFRPSGSSGVLVFSHNPLFGHTGNSGLSGSYLFDGQASATSLLVALADVSGSYPTIPSTYLFSVKGNSNFNGRVQVNNTVGVGPTNNTTPGLNMSDTATYCWIQTHKSKPLALNPIPHTGPSKDSSYVAIGFKPGTFNVPLNYKLAVKGKIICEELKIKFAGLWSDYVFEKNYKLRELKEVEKYIEENKHLPDVPSASEVNENGFETGEMNATLLRKIEELTLYMIEINKQVDQLKKENIELKQAIKK